MTPQPAADPRDDVQQAARQLLEVLQGEAEAPKATDLEGLILRLLRYLDADGSMAALAAAEALRELLALDCERENEMIIDALMHDAEVAIANFLG